jgi:Ni,Fe-hydrogenase I small subunit
MSFDRILAGVEKLTTLCVEGSIINGPHDSGMYDTFDGRPERDLVRALCDRADYVIAMGTCAAYGGIPAASPNPTQSCGTAEKVGYTCVGCIGAKFPLNKPLFHQVQMAKKELTQIPPAEVIFFIQGGHPADEGIPSYG